MRIFTKTLSVLVILTICSSCASIVSRTNWPLTVNTDPAGAKVEITDKKGITVFKGTTPMTTLLKSGAGYFSCQSYKVKMTMEGYGERIIPVECTLNGWYIGNIFIGGLLGMLIVDPLTGAMYRLDREYISETLTKDTANMEPSLRIMNMNDIPDNLKAHLVCIE